MLVEFIKNTWSVLVELGIWMMLGAIFAGVLHVFLPANFILRHLGKNSFSNVLKAVLLGVPMPLCSCGVIPASVGLKKDGASNGASIGFLISTPQTGLDSIFVSASFMGLPFALFKVGSAFVTGLLGGLWVNLTDKPDQADANIGNKNSANNHPGPILKKFNDFVFGDLIYSIWRLLVIGILVSAAITTFVPQNALAGSPMVTGLTGKFLVLIFSLGLYVCATSSVPIAASLVAAGMPMGSALVFLMAGPATNIATMGTVLKTFGKKILMIYLVTISAGSIILGYLFDNLFQNAGQNILMHHEHHSLLKVMFGIFFTGLLLYYAFKDLKSWLISFLTTGSSEQSLTLNVDGMTCQVCAKKVKGALSEVSGVGDAVVDLDAKTVTITGSKLDKKSLSNAVIKKGYRVK